MSESKHTPGPMTIELTGQDGGGDKLMILHPDPNDFQVIRSLGRLWCYATKEENEANMKRIALCWNSYDKLLDACRDVRLELNLLLRLSKLSGVKQVEATIKNVKKRIIQVNNAITLAEKEV